MEADRMDMKLEVVVIPVSDVDRAKKFYTGLGFREDVDYDRGDGYRIVQLTPPGSACSIIFGTGVTAARPGSIDRLVLAVADMDAARETLRARGVEASVFHDAGGGLGGGFYAGSDGRAPGRDPEGRSYATYASFADPDGNRWLLQQITARLPGRV
jgi:catechol 2,3-dioxygenase-like lactoylglutathione lyase family enzyme